MLATTLFQELVPRLWKSMSVRCEITNNALRDLRGLLWVTNNSARDIHKVSKLFAQSLCLLQR